MCNLSTCMKLVNTEHMRRVATASVSCVHLMRYYLFLLAICILFVDYFYIFFRSVIFMVCFFFIYITFYLFLFFCLFCFSFFMCLMLCRSHTRNALSYTCVECAFYYAFVF